MLDCCSSVHNVYNWNMNMMPVRMSVIHHESYKLWTHFLLFLIKLSNRKLIINATAFFSLPRYYVLHKCQEYFYVLLAKDTNYSGSIKKSAFNIYFNLFKTLKYLQLLTLRFRLIMWIYKKTSEVDSKLVFRTEDLLCMLTNIFYFHFSIWKENRV